MPTFYTRFKHGPRVGFHFNKPSMTEQYFQFECDINNIVNDRVQSSLKPSTQQPIFNAEFKPNSYNDALNFIADTKSKFEQLPSSLRAEFDNNPQKLIDFVSDDSNRERAVKLGLISSDKIVKPTPTMAPLTPVEGAVTGKDTPVDVGS